jgi:hypothetical protein
MSTSGIPSGRKKLARANVHLAELRSAVDDFRTNSSYEFAVESPGNERWKPDIPVTVRVTQAPPIPDDWALIGGDILTNVRAALDHAVFPHIRAKKPDLDRKLIQYPIEDGKVQWENKKKWFKSPVTKVVGQSQPYRKGTDFATHPLRVLRDLVNRDKHRDLVIASYAMSAFTVGEHDLYTVVSTKAMTCPCRSVLSSPRRISSSRKTSEANGGNRWHTRSSTASTSRFPMPDQSTSCR